jgi:hypothetical protein
MSESSVNLVPQRIDFLFAFINHGWRWLAVKISVSLEQPVIFRCEKISNGKLCRRHVVQSALHRNETFPKGNRFLSFPKPRVYRFPALVTPGL